MRTDSPVKDILLGVAALAAVAAIGGALTTSAASEVEMKQTGLQLAQQRRLEDMASVSLFGQFRSSIADFLWMKVDKYLHNGVELRGLTPYEQKKQSGGTVHTAASDVAAGYKQHEAETTEVPSARNDWRGTLGDLEREVQPYQDMSNHRHRDPKEALPLFRLMTAANPNFIPGYVYGAAMIARDKTKYQQALDFLKEGERNNPGSIEIKTELGMFYADKLRQFAAAPPYLTEALNLVAQRDQKTLTEDESEAWQNAYRWLVLSYRYQGDREKAHAAAIAGLKAFPNDVTCRKQMEIERTGEWRQFVVKPTPSPAAH